MTPTGTSMHTLPLTAELIAGLDALIPEKCPDTDMPEREIWFYAGKRALVRTLKIVYAQQEKHIKESAAFLLR